MAPEFGQWTEVLPRHLASERETLQSRVTADRRRVAVLKQELAAVEGHISVNERQVRILGSQIAAARELPVIDHPLAVPGIRASLMDFISEGTSCALLVADDLQAQKYVEDHEELILAGRRLVKAGFDPDRRYPVPEPKIMTLDEQRGTVQIGDGDPMRISPLVAICLKPFYDDPEVAVPVQSIIENSGGKSGPNSLDRWANRVGIPVFKKERKGGGSFWSLDLEWVQPLPYIEQIRRKEQTGFAVLDAVVSQIFAQSVPSYLDLHRALGPSGRVDIYSGRIHKISDDSQTRILDFYTPDELAAFFTPHLKELFEQSKEDSKRALWVDIKAQIWNKIEFLMKRFKVNKYDAFLRKLSRVIKDSEEVYYEANSIKTPVKSAVL